MHQLGRADGGEQHLDDAVALLFDGVGQQQVRDREDRDPQQVDEADRRPLARDVLAVDVDDLAALGALLLLEDDALLDALGDAPLDACLADPRAAQELGDGVLVALRQRVVRLVVADEQEVVVGADRVLAEHEEPEQVAPVNSLGQLTQQRVGLGLVDAQLVGVDVLEALAGADAFDLGLDLGGLIVDPLEQRELLLGRDVLRGLDLADARCQGGQLVLQRAGTGLLLDRLEDRAEVVGAELAFGLIGQTLAAEVDDGVALDLLELA